ncbi:MAG: hypothetical protein H7Y10_01180 [Flavobacterium sp.]|nr:hypothetical protein [Flavobacterium sp.]
MEKLYIIITVLLKEIVGSYAQPVLNPQGFCRNEFWNFSGMTATFEGTINAKHIIPSHLNISIFRDFFVPCHLDFER